MRGEDTPFFAYLVVQTTTHMAVYNRRSFVNALGTFSATAFLASLTRPAWSRNLDKALDDGGTSCPEQLAGDEDFWYYVQQSFTVSPELINLNNGGVSPSPKVVQDAMKRYLDFSNEAPSYYMWRILDQGSEPLRKDLARIAGCSPEESCHQPQCQRSVGNGDLRSAT
jgi:hypothetical protein